MSHFRSTPRSFLPAIQRPQPRNSINQPRGVNRNLNLNRNLNSEPYLQDSPPLRSVSIVASVSGQHGHPGPSTSSHLISPSNPSALVTSITSSQRTRNLLPSAHRDRDRDRSCPIGSWEVIYRSLIVTYVMLIIWLVLMTIASWLQHYCQIRPDEFPICRAIAQASADVMPEPRVINKPVTALITNESNRMNLVRPSSAKAVKGAKTVEVLEQSVPPSAGLGPGISRSLPSIPPLPPRAPPRPSMMKLMKSSDVGEGLNSANSQRMRHELFQELESYFLRGNKFKPSSIPQFKGNKTDRAPNLPIDHDILVYGRGPMAYAVVYHLLKHHHDVVLITPDSYEVTTHYLIGSGAHIDIPNSIRFYLESLCVTSATTEELDSLARSCGVPIPFVTRLYDEFITSLEIVESTAQADAMINELNSTITPIQTYRLNLQTRYPVPDKVIRRGLVKSFSEKLAGTYVEVLFEPDSTHDVRLTNPGTAISWEQILRCRKFILADEFLPNIPALWPTWLKAAPKLSGPFGYQFESIFPSVPFSKVVLAGSTSSGSAPSSSGSALISMHHTGEMMTISVSQVFPYLRLDTGGYYLKASVVHQSDPVIESQLRQILRELGDESLDPATESSRCPPIDPINLAGGSWGLRPTGLISCHKHYRLDNYQSVWIVGPLFLPATRDWIRDTCIIASMIDRIIA
jgi:hypothetical protein